MQGDIALATILDGSAQARAETRKPNSSEFQHSIFIRASCNTVWHALKQSAEHGKNTGTEKFSVWPHGLLWKLIEKHQGYMATADWELLQTRELYNMHYSFALYQGLSSPHIASRVRFQLQEVGAATRLHLTHSGLEQGTHADQEIRDQWLVILSELRSILKKGNRVWNDRDETVKISTGAV